MNRMLHNNIVFPNVCVCYIYIWCLTVTKKKKKIVLRAAAEILRSRLEFLRPSVVKFSAIFFAVASSMYQLLMTDAELSLRL